MKLEVTNAGTRRVVFKGQATGAGAKATTTVVGTCDTFFAILRASVTPLIWVFPTAKF